MDTELVRVCSREGRNIMSMIVDGLPSQYNGYKINVGRIKQKNKKIVTPAYVIRLNGIWDFYANKE